MVGAALLAAGCSGADRTASDPAVAPTGATPGPFASASDIVLPLDGYVLDGAEARDVARARTALLDECVLRYTQVHYVPEVATGATPAFSPYRFGLVGTASAREHGYHDPADELSESFAVAHPVRVPPGRPTASYLLDGDVPAGATRPLDPGGAALPDDGCAGEAETFLGGTVAENEFAERAITAIEEAERADPRVRAAIAAWADCMKDADHDYANPLDPVVEYGGAAAVTEGERVVAQADADCRVATSYVERRVAVLTDLQQRSLDADPDRWEAHRSALAERVRRARGYLDLDAASGRAEDEAQVPAP